MRTIFILATVLLSTAYAAVNFGNVHFCLYTGDHMDRCDEMFINNANLQDYRSWQRTVILTHSMDQTGTDDWILLMKTNYFVEYQARMNIIIVDWAEEATGLYGNVKDRVEPIGIYMGDFINYLAENNQNMSITHCVGFGLGAHACGFAGKRVQTYGRKIERITGIEPRKEQYNFGNPAQRLAVTDAVFVDVIHTASDRWSMVEPLGHADFYPNGGEGNMPGCGLIEPTGACNHHRGYEYFTESIKSVNFVSTFCDSYRNYNQGDCAFNEKLPMGEQCPPSASGTYYLDTYGYVPFAMG